MLYRTTRVLQEKYERIMDEAMSPNPYLPLYEEVIRMLYSKLRKEGYSSDQMSSGLDFLKCLQKEAFRHKGRDNPYDDWVVNDLSDEQLTLRDYIYDILSCLPEIGGRVVRFSDAHYISRNMAVYPQSFIIKPFAKAVIVPKITDKGSEEAGLNLDV